MVKGLLSTTNWRNIPAQPGASTFLEGLIAGGFLEIQPRRAWGALPIVMGLLAGWPAT